MTIWWKSRKTRGEPHLLAVAGRWWLKEVVTDALLARRYPSVSRRIVGNPGARVSAGGFAIIVAQAEADPELAVERRHPGRFAIGTSPANSCATRRKRSGQGCCRARRRICSRKSGTRSRPYRGERRSRNVKGPRFHRRQAARREAQGKGPAQRGRPCSASPGKGSYEETVVALGGAVAYPPIEVIRPLMQSLRDDGLLVAVQGGGAQLGNHGRRAGMPLFDRLDGRGRDGQGKKPIRTT